MPRFAPNGDHSAASKTELRRKLRLARDLEVKAGEELDRLISVALELGLKDREISELSGLTVSAIGMRRSKPVFCVVCTARLGYRGRGRPRRFCDDCRGGH